MKVLVTGSEGFVGTKVCEGLRDAGMTVFPYDIVLGDDLFDTEKLAKSMKGMDAVIHLAAYPHRHSVRVMWKKKEDEIDRKEEFREFVRLNVEGTKQVYEEAVKANVPRFIYASSGAVYGFEDGFPTPSGIITISDHPDVNDAKLHPYARSKLLAEEILWLLHRTLYNAPETIILRVNWIQDPTLGNGISGPEWKGATCSIRRMVDGFVNAVRAEIFGKIVTVDLIEKNETWEGSIDASDILFRGE